ncbi:preprotein translocase subunit SecG [uncultured Sphingomonas sp.]|uniref:preprotein translocase subunit SecG n=1 Tax=uncultured Sphingomonas sp. TaxID=158754 RepID=UPI0035CC22D2
MVFTFLLVIQTIIAVLLVTVILMQRSEGGGLGTGGSPSGLMSARGTADFLTRSTAGLATAFVALSITLAVLAAMRHATVVDTSLNRIAPAAAATAAPPADNTPFAGAAANAAAAAGANTQAAPTTPPADNGAVPLER